MVTITEDRKLLIVDDESPIRRVIRRRLASEWYCYYGTGSTLIMATTIIIQPEVLLV
jgi:DNA-binding NtrC family response regulator